MPSCPSCRPSYMDVTHMDVADHGDLMTWLWLRQGVIHTKGTPSAAFDNMGMIFAVITERNSVRLYDARAYQRVRAHGGCLHNLAILPVRLCDARADQRVCAAGAI